MRRRLLGATSVVLGIVVGCATYDGIQTPRASDPADSGGAGGTDPDAGGTPLDDSAGSNQGGASGSGDSNAGGNNEGDAGGGDSNAGDAGEGGSSGSGGRAGMDSGGRAGAGSGGRAGAGSGGRAGAGGSTSAAGSSGLPGAGTSGTGGSIVAGAGGSIVAGAGGASTDDQLLSQGKSVVADSTQAGNAATLGNDGSIVTRWCAANGDPNHYWQVDLGVTRTLSRVDIAWEKAANYKFKVEGSTDSSTWAMLVDKTTTTSSASGQSYKLDTAPKARWVKITITGLPNSTSWASFYELQVFGH